ncbi:MAG: hypothetical protein NTZ05_02675, partial [Chloroflexi bacterium]|nr:hypothetical protein [Chloroflexota bacterium]
MNSGRPRRARMFLGLALGAVAVLAPALDAYRAQARGDVTNRISLGAGGTQANKGSDLPAISADGRFVAFTSEADNLVTGDANGRADVFLRDLTTNETKLISASQGGQPGNLGSLLPAVSADGRFVAFTSAASDLVSGDTNGKVDVFLRDRTNNLTTRVSVGSDGAQGNNHALFSAISADGRFVAFASDASNLVPGDTNAATDVFLFDRTTSQTMLVSAAPGGTPASGISGGAAISADGRFVAFESLASNLVTGDTNGKNDIFLLDRTANSITRVSVTSAGAQANDASGFASLSADGRFVAFASSATNLVANDTNKKTDAFVMDRTTGQVTRVSIASDGTEGNDSSTQPILSADGRTVAFLSLASNLVPGDTNNSVDVFVRDLTSGQTTRVSVASDGTQGNKFANGLMVSGLFGVALSGDGQRIAFTSQATNLAADDTNGVSDIFLHDRSGGGAAPGGTPTPAPIGSPTPTPTPA